MKKITEQHFYDLLSLKLSGDASAEELALLQQQLLLHPQWQFLYDQMMQQPPSLNNQLEHTQQAYAAHFIKMQLQGKFEKDQPSQQSNATASIHISQKRIYSKWWYGAVAATVIGILVLATVLRPKINANDVASALNEIVTKKGSKSNIKLPDGTMVWLNADSKLSYTENFNGKTREVTLIGEAYFDVVHDSAHPFIIHTGKANIKVLGTAFNIRNYPQDKSLETTLMRGKIEVSFSDHPGEKIIMKPLEKLIIGKDNTVQNKPVADNKLPATTINKMVLTGITYADKDSTVSETSWMDDKMVFINQPLEKIAQELERNFDISVIFKNAETKNYRYTGVFDNVNLDKVLQIIHLSNKHVNYKVEDRNVIIY